MAMKKNTNTNYKPKREYIKLAEALGSSCHLQTGDMWLKSAKEKDWAPGVSINTGDNETLSDWVRHITLQDVTVTVTTRKGRDGKDYPELVITGGDCVDTPF